MCSRTNLDRLRISYTRRPSVKTQLFARIFVSKAPVRGEFRRPSTRANVDCCAADKAQPQDVVCPLRRFPAVTSVSAPQAQRQRHIVWCARWA